MEKVFISSVIEGFESERETARTTVESLGMQAVMAERFGAQPIAPRTACLAEVAECHSYVAILGSRYGHPTADGTSPTEQEFHEARRKGLPILLFVKNCQDRDDRQTDFIRRIGDYDDGYTFHKFCNNAELASGIAGALHKMGRLARAGAHDATTASLRVQGVTSDLRSHSGDVVLAVVTLAGDRDCYCDLIELAKPESRETLQRQALFGATALFDVARGLSFEEREDHVALRSNGSQGRSSELRIYSDYTTAYLSHVESESDETQAWCRSFLSYHVIDEETVAERILRGVRYADKILPRSRVGAVFVSVTIADFGDKSFGRTRGYQSNSFSYGGGELPDPLLIPALPLRTSRNSLANGEPIQARLVEEIARRFRLSNRYFIPARRGLSRRE